MTTKKPGRKPVLRTKIERYMAKHPDAKPAEVAKACNCKVGYVYTVRNKLRKEDALPKPKPVVEPPAPEPSFLQRLKMFVLMVFRGDSGRGQE